MKTQSGFKGEGSTKVYLDLFNNESHIIQKRYFQIPKELFDSVLVMKFFGSNKMVIRID